MAVSVHTVVDDRVAKYVSRVTAQQHATEAAVVRDLVESGYEEIFRHLHGTLSAGGTDVSRRRGGVGTCRYVNSMTSSNKKDWRPEF